MKRATLALLVLLFATPAVAGTITFEGMPQNYWYFVGQQNFGSYWEGVYFGPESTILEKAVYGYNDSGYPPHSGDAVLFSISTPYIEAVFDSPVDFVSLWYSSASNFYVDFFDGSNTQIGSVMGGANTFTNSYLSFTSGSSDIKRVLMHDSGNFFSIDDFTAPIVTGEPSGQVPEPGSSLLLLGMGLVGLGAWRKRLG